MKKLIQYITALLFYLSFRPLLHAQQYKHPGIINNNELAQNIRIAVMATGEFDHCGFGLPRWEGKKWLHIKATTANNTKYRKRKCCIEITSATDSSKKSAVYFWIEQSANLSKAYNWEISGCHLIY